MAEVREVAVEVAVTGAKGAAGAVEGLLETVDEATGTVDTALGTVEEWNDSLADVAATAEETSESLGSGIDTAQEWNDSLADTVGAGDEVFATIDSGLGTVEEWNDSLADAAAMGADASETIGSGVDTVGQWNDSIQTAASVGADGFESLSTGVDLVGSAARSAGMALNGPLLLAVLAIVAVAIVAYAVWESNFLGIRDIVLDVTETIRTVLSGALETLRVRITTFVTVVTTLWSEVFGPVITETVTVAFGLVKAIVGTYVDAILTTIRAALALLRGDWKEAWNLMAGFLERSAERFRSAARAVAGRVRGVFTDLVQSSAGWGKDIPGTIANGVRNALSDLTNAMTDLGSQAADAFRDAFNDVVPSSVGLPSKTVSVPEPIGGSVTVGGGSMDLPRLRHGGYVDRGGLARLHAGEMVVPAAQVAPDSPPAAGGGTTTVVFESGAVQVDGAGSPRRTADRTAEEVSETIQSEFSERR
ncbi:hypothetical protein [Salinilacihabitans rarus]|uniref:hypothetical protein n=1 Tax=Salinilacihabitans rarus TaxID=2961596 RepID=UPI0020C88FDB|nr:hypothetical protein [Salinilacihabitans rarus]